MNPEAKILCVDDSGFIRTIIVQAAKAINMETIEAEDGQEALDYVCENYDTVALITLDWHMPRMDGFDFLNIIKQNEDTKDIPVIMLTSESDKKNIIKAIKAGVCSYVLKPFTQDELIAKMETYMRDV